MAHKRFVVAYAERRIRVSQLRDLNRSFVRMEQIVGIEELDELATKSIEQHDINSVSAMVHKYGKLLEKFPNRKISFVLINPLVNVEQRKIDNYLFPMLLANQLKNC